MTGTSSAGWHIGEIVAPLSAPDHAAAIRLLTVLRPALEPDEAGVFLTEAMSSGYEIALSRPAGTDTDPIGLAGFRVLPTSRGRILLLEDFVVEEASRGPGREQSSSKRYALPPGSADACASSWIRRARTSPHNASITGTG